MGRGPIREALRALKDVKLEHAPKLNIHVMLVAYARNACLAETYR